MINIAIDGPAGAGKSTIAKAVAKDLGIIYLDTGAMYRATAYLALQKGIDVKDEEKVAEMLEDLTMDIKYDENGAQRIIVNGIDATPYLREHYMSKAASDISALPCVRYKMVDLQRDFASKTFARYNSARLQRFASRSRAVETSRRRGLRGHHFHEYRRRRRTRERGCTHQD